MPTFATRMPLASPMSDRRPKRHERQLGRHAGVVHEHVHDERHEAEDAADREVEDPGREQQRHAQGDDAELGDEREHVARRSRTTGRPARRAPGRSRRPTQQRDGDDLGARDDLPRSGRRGQRAGHRRRTSGDACHSTQARGLGRVAMVSARSARRRAGADRPASLRGQCDVLVGRRGVVQRLRRDVVADGQAGRRLVEQDDRVVARRRPGSPRWRR